MIADYNPMGLAVPRMDDDLPSDMSTVFSDTDVTKALTSTMMLSKCYGNYTDTKPSYYLWHNSKYKCMAADILRPQ